MDILNHVVKLSWEKTGKSAEWPNWAFQSFQTTLVGNDGKMFKMIIIGHSKSFWTALVGKDGKKYEMVKIGCSE